METEIEILTAERAREIAMPLKGKSKLAYILKEVEKAAKLGRFSCTYDGTVDDETISEIKERGFNICMDPFNEVWTVKGQGPHYRVFWKIHDNPKDEESWQKHYL